MNKISFKLFIFFHFLAFSLLISSNLFKSEVYAKKTYKIKVGAAAPDSSPWGIVYHQMQKETAKKTKNKLRIKLLLGGVLGGEKNCLKMIFQNKIDFFGGSIGALANKIPELSILELPFLFDSSEEFDEVMEKVVEKEINKLLNQHNLILYFITEVGWRHIGSKKVINSYKDLKGLKIRSQQNKLHTEFWKFLGIQSVPIAVTETQIALQTELVNAFDSSIFFTYLSTWYQNISNFSLTYHIYQPAFAVVSSKLKEKLPKDLYDIFMKDNKKWGKQMTSQCRKGEKSILNELEQYGIKINSITENEKLIFRSKVKPLWKQWVNNLSPAGQKLFKQVLQAITTYRKKNS